MLQGVADAYWQYTESSDSHRRRDAHETPDSDLHDDSMLGTDTLICGYSWCDVQRGVCHNGRHDDDVWGLAEWVEFDSHRKQVAGTISMSETVWKAAWQIAR